VPSWKSDYRKCIGMNKDGKCRAGSNHLGHRRDMFGVWYGQIPTRKPTPLQKPRKDAKKKKRWWE
jgi:hypothetical protein